MHIDAIDEAERWGKQALFARILNDARLPSDQVLVVGDNPESEIAAGNRLGLHTVQILRPGVIRSDAAVSHVRSLAGLRELLQ